MLVSMSTQLCQKKEAVIRSRLILSKLRSKASNFDEINDFLMQKEEIQSYNFGISKRTFQRDLQDIAYIFSIDIAYDFSIRKNSFKSYCLLGLDYINSAIIANTSFL